MANLPSPDWRDHSCRSCSCRWEGHRRAAAKGVIGEGRRTGWTGQARQTIERIVDIGRGVRGIGQRQPVAVLVVGIAQRDGRLIG